MDDLLKTWGVPEDVITEFQRNSIEESHLPHITEEQLKELCPVMGIRINIKNKIAEYLEAQASTETNATDISLREEVNLVEDISFSLTDLFPIQTSFRNFDLNTLLTTSPCGKSILQYYAVNKCLDTKRRNRLTDIIIRHLYTHIVNHRLTYEDYNVIAGKIITSFPKEAVETYFTKPIKKRDSYTGKSVAARGKLIDKVRNILFESGEKRRRVSSTDEPNCKKSSSSSSSQLESHKEVIEWLCTHNEPWSEVLEKWRLTAEVRHSQEYKNIEDMISQWGILNSPNAVDLNAPNQEPVYRKVAIVENFFDIIYTVHVELEGRPGKHAGQKRTYRTITETYAFLPREAVTRFLTGCAECARRPRSASPPPLPTPSPSPTRHPAYLPFIPHCAADYTRNWESEIDAAHSNYSYEPKYDYTDLQPLSNSIKKVESPKATDSEDQEPTYIELTSKKVNGFESTPLFSRSSPVEPPFREEEPVRTDPEIDKDENSLIDVEDVKIDSPPPAAPPRDDAVEEEPDKDTTATEIAGVKEEKTDVRKEKKYNPLDVVNLTSKDPPKSASPPRKKLLPSSLEYGNSFERFPKPWRPDCGAFFGGEEVDYSVPITTAYLKHMRSMAYQERLDAENKDNLTPEPSDMNDDDNFSSQAIAKDAEKLKMMLLAWNYHSQSQGRNGDVTESGPDSMADLWASYHSALGLGSKPPKPPTPLATGHSSPIHVGSATPVEPGSTHDETSSSDRTKDDDDGGASDDDSDDRVDPQHHDPERLKAFNMFVRLFVDENLDRIVPISKQPKEKIQAIIDSCTRQFPEFAERARKRIRTYLKSCRRNKKVRGEGPTTGPAGSTTGAANAWDTAVRPTPAHLTSVQAEHILAQACENESLNAKRMRLGLDPVSQPMPTVPTPMAIDSTASSAASSSFLSLYSGAAPAAPAHSKAAADTTRPSVSPTLENALLNNNSLKLDNANGNAGSKTASPASSPAPLFRPSFPTTFGTPQTFGRQSTNTNSGTALSSSALLSTLSALPPSGVGVNAAMAAYQSALLSAMAAHTHTFPTSLAAPTDLSLKTTAASSALHATPTSSLAGGAAPSKPLLSHKLSGAEVGAVRQLITGYRESAAFLLRSADELEALLLNQP